MMPMDGELSGLLYLLSLESWCQSLSCLSEKAGWNAA